MPKPRYIKSNMRTTIRVLRLLIVELANHIYNLDDKDNTDILLRVYNFLPKKFKHMLKYKPQ